MMTILKFRATCRSHDNTVITREYLFIFDAANDLAVAVLGTCAERLIIPCICYAIYT
jgi:hypothetical protein